MAAIAAPIVINNTSDIFSNITPSNAEPTMPWYMIIELLVGQQFETLNVLINNKLINLAEMHLSPCGTLVAIYDKAPAKFANIFNFIMHNGYVLTCDDLGKVKENQANMILDYLETNPHKYDVTTKNTTGQTILYYWNVRDCVKRLLKIYPNYPHYSFDINNLLWWHHRTMDQSFFDDLSGFINMHKKFIPVQGELKSYAECYPDIMEKYGPKLTYDDLLGLYKKKEEEYDQLKARYDSLIDSIRKLTN